MRHNTGRDHQPAPPPHGTQRAYANRTGNGCVLDAKNPRDLPQGVERRGQVIEAFRVTICNRE